MRGPSQTSLSKPSHPPSIVDRVAKAVEVVIEPTQVCDLAIPPPEGVRQKAIGVETTIWREGIRERGICINVIAFSG